MLVITIRVDAPTGQAIGIKNDITDYLERFGDVLSASVEERVPEQLKIGVNNEKV